MDEVITPNLGSLVCEQVRNFIVCQQVSASTGQENGDAPVAQTLSRAISFTPGEKKAEKLMAHTTEETKAADLAKLQHAYDRQVLYIIGKEQMRIKPGTGWVRRCLLASYLWLKDNTSPKIANLRVPTDRVIEVGFMKDV